MTAQTPPRTRIALLLFALVVAYLSVLPAASAEPSLNTGAQTVTWTLNETAGLIAQGIVLENESAVLEWTNASINWTQGSEFDGTFDPTLSPGLSGVELTADSRNHVADGDFAALGPWELLPAQNVSATYEAPLQAVQLGHMSGVAPNESFDQLDTESDPNWSNAGSGLSTCGLSWVDSENDGGGKMIQCVINLDSPAGSWAGVVRNSANWSAYDRLLVRVFAQNVSPQDWWFRITAMAGLTPSETSLQLLTPGWQEITVDLTELGPNRGALTTVRFIIVGSSMPGRIVDFDDIRLANAKSLDETAHLRQDFTKPVATSPSLGGGTLAFNYHVLENSGVDVLGFTVNLSGANASYVREITFVGAGAWTSFASDVSSITAAAGPYSIEFSVRVALRTIAASHAAIRIDNVSVQFPNRRGGSFLSDVVDFGLVSQIPSLRWSAVIPSQTTAVLQLRTGDESEPSGSTWSAWHTWNSPGSYPSGGGPHRYLQVGLNLDTVNASRTPVVHSVQVDVRHRLAVGWIEAEYNVTDLSFGRWSLMKVESTIPSGGGVSLFVRGERGLMPVPSNGGLSVGSPRRISWRVNVTTSDGLTTPQLSAVVLTYERSLIPANVAEILLSPFMFAALSAAVLGYSSYVIVRRRSFAVDDLFLVSREGRLMMHNTRRMRPDRDEDILSGMLTAILAFVKDSDPESNGELHQFKVGDKTTVLEKGQHSYVAATYSGRVPPWAAKDLRRFLKDLEARFGSAFAQWSGDPEDLQGLQEFTARFVARARYRPSNATNGRGA